ncbi:LANO_0G03312g1_1 [Lachancea nothofagi CBS 11611]|uniref:LANO_0G03312g1_1 n=1 Tax=Lachancea nothofagi CBS 11611 TaxID=1266666 RepID=A0A1G4KFF9_9SACH|nr:LANO_0G03312g1_1 [Lachancea nothofagi CBS 11611]
MTFPGTPKLITRQSLSSVVSSACDVTPTKPLDLRETYAKSLENNESMRSSESRLANGSYLNKALNREPNSTYSPNSLIASASELSFKTADSFTTKLDEQEYNGELDHERTINSTTSSGDHTPIVAPHSAFDNSTPVIGNDEPYKASEYHSTDSFNFVEPSYDPVTSGLGISSTNFTAGGNDEYSGLHTDFSKLNSEDYVQSHNSPSKISHSSLNSPKKLARKSIHDAHFKNPVNLPTHAEDISVNTSMSMHSAMGSDTNEDTLLSNEESRALSTEQSGLKDPCIGVERKHTFKRSSELDLDESNLAYLFIVAVHSFNSQSLKNEEDMAICLSFEKNDVAFVHTVDESGWGEVTLIRTQKRGWVPFNYFSDMTKTTSDEEKEPGLGNDSRGPLKKLLSSSAKFLLHPQDFQLPDGLSMSFSLKYINGIRDGVKYLLEATGCVSRSNELVKTRTIVKKARKLLLADWYNLMIKADSYKNTTEQKKLTTLINLTFQVLRRGCAFYTTWSLERQAFDKEKELGLIQPLNKDRPAITASSIYEGTEQVRPSTNLMGFRSLGEPPFAVQRLNEVHDILFSYIGLILGRLDMIEHNPVGCEVLESIVHQIIVLLRELLYISKCCSSIVQNKFKHIQRDEVALDQSLDPLLSLVSELVSCIKIFVTQTMNEDGEKHSSTHGGAFIKDEAYFYTDEGKRLMSIIAMMTGLISVSIQGCHRYLKIVGNFQLGGERSYPDFESLKISSDQFIRRCSIGLAKKLSKGSKGRLSAPKVTTADDSKRHPYSKKLYRYSMVRSGGNGNSLTSSGTQLLQDVMPENMSFFSDASFDKYRLRDGDLNATAEKDAINNRDKMTEETLRDKDGKLVGASHRALVFELTDELGNSSEFLLSTFLLNFRSFSNALDLISELIARFDIPDKSSIYERNTNNGQYSSRSSRMKNRRRMVCRVFQTWMESYWDYQGDFNNLATIVNFFNEGISIHLPIEARNLIEIAAKLVLSLTASKRPEKSTTVQISPRDINIPSRNSIISLESSASSKRSTIISVDENIMDDYELTKLPSAQTSTISIPLPLLNVGTSSLLSRRQLSEMERLTKNYHSMLYVRQYDTGNDDNNSKLSLEGMIERWSALIKKSSSHAVPPNLIHNDLNLVELNPLEVAKQLSLIESNLFLAVRPGELLNQNFIPRKKHLAASPDIEKIIDFSNLLSNYVIESIVAPRVSLKMRASRLTTWLNIALSALYFRNFNSVATIMTALQSHILSRLSPVWENISEKYAELFHYLSKIIHPNKNYNVYRTKLHKLATGFSPPENVSVKSHVPVVPFFALFLQDLTFLHEGLNDFRDPTSFRPNKLVNIDKYTRITKVISLVQFFQVPYDTDERPNFLGSKRDSFFNLSGNADIDTTRIKPVSVLQEFMLYEFWRTNVLYSNDSDRGYKLSLGLIPRNEV